MKTTHLAHATTKRGDVVNLHETDVPFTVTGYDDPPHRWDGHRSRFLFEAAGRELSGWGAVSGNVTWLNRHGQKDPLAEGAEPILNVTIDAYTVDLDLPPLTLRGVRYRGMVSYQERDAGSLDMRIMNWFVDREDYSGKVTDAASATLNGVFDTVRDLFLGIDGVRDALVDRSLRGEIGTALIERDKAQERADRLRTLQYRITDAREA